jgi:hypothetical protein
MSIIKTEEIVGYFDENGIVCIDCITDDDNSELKLDQVITQNMVPDGNDELWFCDLCKRRL